MKRNKGKSFLLQTVEFAYENGGLTILAASLVGALGVVAFLNLNIDAYPDISGVQVQIISEYTGRAAEEVEQQVTIPIERVMYGIKGVEIVRSRSIFGLSLVQVIFESGTNDYFARSQVFEKISEVDVPSTAVVTLGGLTTAYGEIYRYELTQGGETNPLELRTIHDWTVIPKLSKIKGVAGVANFGGLGKQYSIQLIPVNLLRYGVTLQDVINAVQINNSNGGGSILERGSSATVIRGLGRIKDYKELENILIKNSFGTNVYVRDIGSVIIDHRPRTGVFGKDEKNDSIEGIVQMRRGENPSQVLDRIHSEIKELNDNVLPENIKIKPFYDRTFLIENTLVTVIKNTLLGIILVIITLLMFLGNLRMAVLVALTIPFSLQFALLMMYLADIPISLLSVGSIDFGIIVDGSVIISENVMRHFSMKAKNKPADLILKASKEVQKPMLFSMVIVILAYIPLLSLTKIEGLLFRPMAFTLCFALFGAILFALYIAPTVIKSFFSSADYLNLEEKRGLFEKIEVSYARLLPIILKKRKQVAFVFFVFFIFVSVVIIPKLGTEFLPYMDEGTFWLRANFPEGISIAETTEYSAEIRKELRNLKEVNYVTSQTGRNDLGNDPFPLNRVEFMIGLKDKADWVDYSTKSQLETAIRKKIKSQFPTVKLNLTQPIIDSVTEDTNGTSADLAVDITGPDMRMLRQIASQTVSILQSIEGSVNVNIEQEAPQAQSQILIDKDKLSRYRLSADSMNNVINTAVGGLPISEIYENEKRFDILVKYSPEFRNTITSIKLLPIFNEQGEAVPLGQIAKVLVNDGETIIARARGERRLTVRCDIRNKAQGDFVDEAKLQFQKRIRIPKGYKVEWLGMFENLERARIHFLILIPISAAIIFIVLNFMFQSYLKAGLMMFSVPFAMTGSFIALYLRGMHLSVSAAVGLTTLFGIATMHGILMISNIMHVQASELNLNSAIIQGSKIRLRPVLMTAFVAFIGLLPASLATEIGSDIQRPIATVMVWGIFSSAILTLIILPVFYSFLEEWNLARKEK
ncbi:efflux RND transporter permease subunit [Leptospira ilyithenensis]|uniref:Efflux RND transporter permease subunit n=1 Tax=Leptospira ilyithenensis TaxID=2484901 RepID=A0A4R9LUW1_9LEPT|nr:CusA/CzcA family heavy metal efflux RND transporter [Leptospira ilyithenensis]TGN11626.1 efflux RND transporter permease subunit [Leptospira ilyithenensis]